MSRQDKNTKKKKAEDLLSFFFPSGDAVLRPCINFKIYTRAYPYGLVSVQIRKKKKLRKEKDQTF